MTRRTSLVTGATAGIGAEFARQLAASGSDLVIVARDAARLESVATALRSEHGVDVEVLPADLLSPSGLRAVEARVSDSDRPIDLLVNNAGYGLRRSFDENTILDEERHLDLHVRVTMRLAHAALSQMLPRRSGTIVNIASVAGFTPRGTYGAAKAWVLSFSRWANWYYRKQGVTVTAVAPGFVRTEFHERMGASIDGIPAFMWLEAPRLVRIALRDIARGKAISVPTIRYKTVVALAKVLPTPIVAAGALRGR